MSRAPVSVIVVSRGRPALLPRCLTGIGQLCYPAFEIVVVTDAGGAAAVRTMGWEERVKLVAFDQANISAARNAGIAASAGEIVAFIDDDAVPEPTWLDHLAAPFSNPDIAATGGFVIGRNGISFQWTARAVNAQGHKIVLEHSGEAPFEPQPPEGFITKTEGTNCAFRRAVLAKLGGFDPAFRFYMDETDVNLRLAQAGGRTVMVPLARVHHGFAASPRRAPDRAPRNLAEIGASTAVFLRKHAPGGDMDSAFKALRAAQRKALLGHMVGRGLEPGDVGRLLKGLGAGFVDGQRRQIATLKPLCAPALPFKIFFRPGFKATPRLFAGRSWHRARLRREAAQAVASGEIVTLFCFSPTTLPHRVYFHPDGWWEQRGGLFGPALRDEPAFRFHRFGARVRKEWARVAKLRQCQPLDGIS